MERKATQLFRASAVKWLVMFAFVLAVALPGSGKAVRAAGTDTYTVSVSEGYLALRTAKAYDASNEIGRLYSGYTVEVMDYSDNTYWYVYSPTLGQYGYVNCNYLISAMGSSWTVQVSEGYLALRTAKAYDASNEIGELYSGDTVWLYDASDATYWYVYSPKYGQYGYVNKDYLYGGSIGGSCDTGIVSVSEGYLALRTAKAYDAANEIGKLYSGDIVQLLDTRDSAYWYVYAPKLGRSGFVNKDYLVGGSVCETRIVSVSEGYLALRTAKAYEAENEIGELYTGDTVQLIDTSDSAYWYVYSPRLGKSGFVNRNYLTGGGVETWTVSVSEGYLALRTAKAYDSANEIGKLYSGETVQVIEKDDSDYWYVYSAKLDRYGYVNKKFLY